MKGTLLRHRALAPVAVLTAGTLLGVATVCGSGTQTAVETAPSVGAPPVDTATAAPTGTPADQTAIAATPSPITLGIDWPTPSAGSDMGITGGVWIDGERAEADIRAFINGQQCGEGQAVSIGAPRTPLFAFAVSSDAHQPGCGVPGAAVTFTINGRPGNETITWQPGASQLIFALSAGGRIAIYQGTLRLDRGRPPAMVITPLIGGVACGDPVAPQFNPADAKWSYLVVVDSGELRAGCGRDGATVTLRLEVEGQPAIDIPAPAWKPLPPIQILTVDLTGRIPVSPGSELGLPKAPDQ